MLVGVLVAVAVGGTGVSVAVGGTDVDVTVGGIRVLVGLGVLHATGTIRINISTAIRGNPLLIFITPSLH